MSVENNPFTPSFGGMDAHMAGCDDEFMTRHFQSMTMNPDNAARAS